MHKSGCGGKAVSKSKLCFYSSIEKSPRQFHFANFAKLLQISLILLYNVKGKICVVRGTSMDLFSILTLVGGLSFFLFGMSLMGSGLEKISGGRMKGILEKVGNARNTSYQAGGSFPCEK